MKIGDRRLKYVEKNKSRHGNVRYYFRLANHPRARLPDAEADIDAFVAAYDALLNSEEVATAIRRARRATLRAKLAATRAKNIPKRRERNRYNSDNLFSQYISHCRERALRKGLGFALSATWVEKRFAEQQGRCSVSGISMVVRDTARDRSPFQLSIDRIDSRLGYTPQNCRLVILAVNVAMNTWGEDVLVEIARNVVKTKLPHLE